MFSCCVKPTIRDIHVDVGAGAEDRAGAREHGDAQRSRSLAAESAHQVSSRIACSLKALRTSGRLRTTCSTAPSRRTVMHSNPIADLRHIRNTPNFARRHRRVPRGREPERQRPARLERIEHAVVPEARGRVVRRSLALVLVEDRLADRLLPPRRDSVLALARQLIALDGRRARPPPARRPSPRCARSATSRAAAARTRARTCRSCRRRTIRR